MPWMVHKISDIAHTGDWGLGKGSDEDVAEGNLVSDNSRPTASLDERAKWITGIITISLKHSFCTMIPNIQKGFVPGMTLDENLHAVMEIQRSGGKHAWPSISFLKASDKVGHTMIGPIWYVGVEGYWIRMLLLFIKDGFGFMVGNNISGV